VCSTRCPATSFMNWPMGWASFAQPSAPSRCFRRGSGSVVNIAQTTARRQTLVPNMSSIPVGLIIVAILFGSALLAMGTARFLPEHHLSAETKSVVSVSMAVVGTLSALVLGLLISTANTSYTAKTHQVTQMSADVISLDRLLRRYGPEAQNIRSPLRRYVAAKLQDLFPENPDQLPNLDNEATISLLEELQSMIQALQPASDAQRWLQGQALQLTATAMATRWELGLENLNKTPEPLVVLVVFWFVILFASFGLFAPANTISITAIFLCSVGVGTAIRMLTELETPFHGLIRISSTPLVHALGVISR